MKIELDIERINKWLIDGERNRAWLGRKLKMSNQSMHYIWTRKPIAMAEKIAAIMGVETKSLIK
jgi:hypothetical protein